MPKNPKIANVVRTRLPKSAKTPKRPSAAVEASIDEQARELLSLVIHEAAINGWGVDTVMEYLAREVVIKDAIIFQNRLTIEALVVEQVQKNIGGQAVH
jgi:hypothetical protein